MGENPSVSGVAGAGNFTTLDASGLTTLAADLVFSQATPEIRGGDADGELFISPSTTNALGGNIVLYGNTHATKAKDIELRATAAAELHYDDSADLWDFAANTITTTGDLQAVNVGLGLAAISSNYTIDSYRAQSGAGTATNTRMRLATSGSASAAQTCLNVSATSSATSISQLSAINSTANVTAGTVGNLDGLYFYSVVSGSSVITTSRSGYFLSLVTTSGNVTTNNILDTYQSHSGAGTITARNVLRIAASLGTGTVTTQKGINILNQGASGTVTAYGLYVTAVSGATNNFTAYFGGDVFCGAATESAGTSGKAIIFGDNAGDPTPGTNTAAIYAKDVAGTVEVHVVDEAGNVSQISPHAKDAPPGIYNDAPGIEPVASYANFYRGDIRWVNIGDSAKAMMVETFTEYNNRWRLSPSDKGYREVQDWEANQDLQEQKIQSSQDDWDASQVIAQQARIDQQGDWDTRNQNRLTKFRTEALQFKSIPMFLRKVLPALEEIEERPEDYVVPIEERPKDYVRKPNPF